MEEPKQKQKATVQCPVCLNQVEGYDLGNYTDGIPTYHAHFVNSSWRAVES